MTTKETRTANDVQLSKHNTEKIAHEVAPRVTDKALIHLMYNEEHRMKDIMNTARTLAKHAGRKTVQEEDVRLALEYEN